MNYYYIIVEYHKQSIHKLEKRYCTLPNRTKVEFSNFISNLVRAKKLDLVISIEIANICMEIAGYDNKDKFRVDLGNVLLHSSHSYSDFPYSG